MIKLNRQETSDLKKILDYLYRDEKKHWEETNKPKEHIFVSIRNLTTALFEKGV